MEIKDNGLGMREEVVEQLLIENNKLRKRGSGVGLINVHQRLQIRFGEQYGLRIESEPDEGTKVIIHLPKIECKELVDKSEVQDERK
jgi:two-component system sensor histidine kinase YesM